MSQTTKEPSYHYVEAQTPESLQGHYVTKEIPTTSDGDVALHLFSNAHELAQSIDPAVERRLVRKIDFHVIPFIAVTYLVTYIDKTTLSYAALFGMQKDLNLVGTQYSWLGSIFYFGYLVSEYPTSMVMQKFSVAKWLAINVFVWGGICAAQGGAQDFGAMAALRFILGMLESCSTPAYLLLTAMFYKVEEQPIRIGIWSTFLGLANSFGGLLAYAIGHISGSLTAWRYEFIIIGAVSAIWGVILFFFLAENPTNARWLNEAERKLAVERLRDNQTGIKNTKFKGYQVIEALLDPKTWFLIIFGIFSQVVNGSVSNFGTLIVQGFNYDVLQTTILQIPYGMIILVSVLSAMFVQRWLPGQKRCIVAAVYTLPALAGVIGIHILPNTSKGAKLGCYFLTATYTAAFAMTMSLVTANTAGSTKRSCVNASFFISYCIGNIVGPFAFKKEEAPTYQSGITAILVAYCIMIVVLLIFAAYLAFLNRQKEKELMAKGMENASDEDKALVAFKDLTDKENVFFRYSY